MKGQEAVALLANRVGAKPGEVKITEYTHYVRAAFVSQGGRQVILNSGQAREVGTTSFQNAQIDKGEVFLCTHICVGDAASTDIHDVQYKSAITDKAFLNGELIIEQDGKTLVKGPVSRFANEAAATNGQNGNFKELLVPFILEDQKPVTIDAAFATGETTATNLSIEVMLMGVRTLRR
jgi:hypothetical protein